VASVNAINLVCEELGNAFKTYQGMTFETYPLIVIIYNKKTYSANEIIFKK